MRAIVVVDRKWGIGKGNDLLFRLPADMKHFKETTVGKVVLMGSNTLLSFPNGKPLKNRVNIVLCPDDVNEDVITVHTPAELFAEVKKYPADDVFVIGGASVYRLLIPYCTEVLVTRVDAVGGADTFVPDLDADENFCLISESNPVEDNGYTISFRTYRNLAPKEY